jgi:hypothetical protein
VGVVWHAVNREKFLVLAGDDAGNVFLEFFFAIGSNEVLAAFHGENDLDVDLGVRVGHGAK